MPPGFTLVFKDFPGRRPRCPRCRCAGFGNRVTAGRHLADSKGHIWASTEEEKKKVMGYFKSKKRKIHLCYRKPQECFQDEHEGLHLSKFHWYPPGDLTASWLTAHGRKAVADGKALAAKTTTDPADEKRKEAHGGESEVETRLSALRKRVPERVSFSASAVRLGRQREDEPRMEGGAGRFGARPKSPSAAVVPLVKKEVEEILSDTASEANKKSKQKKKTMADSLLKAARATRRRKRRAGVARGQGEGERKGGTARNPRAERA